MLLDDSKSLDRISEDYGGVSLKKDFMEIGNAALVKYGVKAELKDRIIRIPYVDKTCDINDAYPEKDQKWNVKISACIELSENQAEGVIDAWYEYEVYNSEGTDENLEYDITDEEYEQAIQLIETFLNATVDA